MQDRIQEMKSSFLREIETISNLEALETLKNDYLGKTGQLNKILSGVKDLAPENKKTVGLLANELKNFITQQLSWKESLMKQAYYRSLESRESLDVTLRFSTHRGSIHHYSLVDSILLTRASALGFEIKQSIEIFSSQSETLLESPEFQTYLPTIPEVLVTLKDDGSLDYDFLLPKPYANFPSLLGLLDGVLSAFFPKGIDSQLRPYWSPMLSGANKIFLNQNQRETEIGTLGFIIHDEESIASLHLEVAPLGHVYL